MTRSIVLDIETRLDRRTLAASGRTTAPRDMPAPLQVVTAVAMLEFARDASGAISDIRLSSREAEERREDAMVSWVDLELARIHSGGGDLITYNGTHDLGVLRLALMRARRFLGAGVSRWIQEAVRHRDLMRGIAAGARPPRLLDVAAGLGFAPPCVCQTAREAGGEARKAEVDVLLTMLLHVHLEAERGGDPSVFASNVLAIGRFIASRALKADHLRGLLETPLLTTVSRLAS